MTPIFLSDTSHRYNTFDYYQIDRCSARWKTLKHSPTRCMSAESASCWMAYSTTADSDSRRFQDAMEKGKASPYYNWFFFGEQYPCGYMTFGEKWAYMPKLNMQNEGVRRVFPRCGRYWLREAHVDGWRLDVSPEVYPEFWRQFRRAVKKTNLNAIMIAECWDDSREWCTIRDMFDGTMHCVLSGAIWKFFAESVGRWRNSTRASTVR